MPQHRTLPQELEATGQLEHNRKRYEGRMDAPQPAGLLGDPPPHFEGDEVSRKLWNEVKAMAPIGVLTSADTILVEVTVSLLKKLRDPEIGLKPVEVGHLRSCLGSMGCTPADRTRVTGSNAPGKPVSDPLADFLPV